MGELLLVADDDPDIRRFIEISLRSEGYELLLAADGEEALRMAMERQPALILLDVMMPKLDGFDVCRRLRADFRTAATPVIMLTARSLGADKVVGLTAGADDYIIKPFDPMELVARVKSTLRRAGDRLATSPLTGLPGNNRIESEIRGRAADGEEFAVCYADLDNFKAYNDRYGFLRGDTAIEATARIIQSAAEQDSPGAFIGHVGGDDFVVLVAPDQIEAFCKTLTEMFDAQAASLYAPEDVAAGGVELPNRQGIVTRFPLLSISVGVAVSAGGVAVSAGGGAVSGRELVDRATEMKKVAKQSPGSVWRVDRRGARSG